MRSKSTHLGCRRQPRCVVYRPEADPRRRCCVVRSQACLGDEQASSSSWRRTAYSTPLGDEQYDLLSNKEPLATCETTNHIVRRQEVVNPHNSEPEAKELCGITPHYNMCAAHIAVRSTYCCAQHSYISAADACVACSTTHNNPPAERSEGLFLSRLEGAKRLQPRDLYLGREIKPNVMIKRKSNPLRAEGPLPHDK